MQAASSASLGCPVGRDWAKASGREISDRGHIPAAIFRDYQAADLRTIPGGARSYLAPGFILSSVSRIALLPSAYARIG